MTGGRTGAAPYLPGAFGAGEAGDQVQCHVDTGADAGRGDEVAVVDPAVDWADLHGGFQPAHLVQCSPVGRRRPPAEQPGSGIDQSAGADTGHQRDGGALGADPIEVFRVAQKPPGAFAAGVYEYPGEVSPRLLHRNHRGGPRMHSLMSQNGPLSGGRE